MTSMVAGEYSGERNELGQREGTGKLVSADGAVYEGDWKADGRHGKGTHRSVDGDLYTGEWYADKRHGVGKMKFADMTEYFGNWMEGKMHGHGSWKNDIGDTYEGDFVKGHRQGKGRLEDANGTVYSGEWKGGYAEGEGTWNNGAGDNYVGQWKNGKFHGEGTFTTESGERYEGQWAVGEKHGKGHLRFEAGEYTGDFAQGIRHGWGRWEGAEDEYVYEGLWENDRMKGEGTRRSKSGKVETGEFHDGELRRSFNKEMCCVSSCLGTCFFILGIFFFIVLVVGTGSTIRADFLMFTTFKPTTCKILDNSQLVKHESVFGAGWAAHFKVEYKPADSTAMVTTYADRPYTYDIRKKYNSVKKQRKFMSQYPPGSETTCFYNPHNYEEVAMEKQLPLNSILRFVLAVIMLGMCNMFSCPFHCCSFSFFIYMIVKPIIYKVPKMRVVQQKAKERREQLREETERLV